MTPFLLRFPCCPGSKLIDRKDYDCWHGVPPTILFEATYARCFPGLLFYITCMYTKLVVIVNERNSVDKSVYLIAFKDLGAGELAVQVLYQTWMAVG
jgi:hypothetical protein